MLLFGIALPDVARIILDDIVELVGIQAFALCSQ